jgi:protoheme IX farnesyltransferase
VSWALDHAAPRLDLGASRLRRGARLAGAFARAAKPRIVALVALTVLVATGRAAPGGPASTVAIVASTALTVGGAALLNNACEHDLDAVMSRTRRRPTADGTLGPRAALLGGLGATAAGVSAVWACGGALAALLAAAGVAYYVGVYTLLIKPRSAFSSLPGGLAGVFPALIGWTAAGGGLGSHVVFLCAVIAVWSPPHFWALAFALQDDYLASGVPTPPVALGERAAASMILAATAALVALSLAPVVTGMYGAIFLLVAAPTGLAFLAVAGYLALRRRRPTAWLLHKLSGPYLAALLLAMVAERMAAR